jgi:hypothetical protein
MEKGKKKQVKETKRRHNTDAPDKTTEDVDNNKKQKKTKRTEN